MQKIFIFTITVFLFTACKNNTTPTSVNGNTSSSEKKTESVPEGRFEFKSGVLITETDMMGMGKATMKLTFDDYGKHTLTEMKMNMMGKDMTTRSLTKDDYAYTWTEPVTMAVKIKIEANNLDDKNIDYKHLSEEMRKKLNMKDEADETIDGKLCKVYSYSMKEGMSGKSFIWKGLPIQTEMNMSGKKVVTKFVSFDENASISATTFDLPSGVEFKEINKQAPTATK